MYAAHLVTSAQKQKNSQHGVSVADNPLSLQVNFSLSIQIEVKESMEDADRKLSAFLFLGIGHALWKS
ncbi:hypothetical protein [uncultured Desulfosarcina sp.]|uniref:hypothetical protein n=1 Tax=uncultured Desulfosarcina sp. TaxID=218289 RepID=UPI0029C63FCA|nr:hypothetical protein [uncultured Desulfosarcina sp.]